MNFIKFQSGHQLITLLIEQFQIGLLQQARDAIHTPDACLMVCVSALDAVPQEKDVMPDKGTLNDRIKAAAENYLITEDVANWVNQIRLEANDIRHPENNRYLVTQEEAQQNLEFTEALAEILFVLPERVTRELEKTEENKIPKQDRPCL